MLHRRGRDMAGFLRRHQRDNQRRRLTCTINCCPASSHPCVSSWGMVWAPGLTVMTTWPPLPWNTKLWDVWEVSCNPSPRGPKCSMACSTTSQGVSPIITSYRIRLLSLRLPIFTHTYLATTRGYSRNLPRPGLHQDGPHTVLVSHQGDCEACLFSSPTGSGAI